MFTADLITSDTKFWTKLSSTETYVQFVSSEDMVSVSQLLSKFWSTISDELLLSVMSESTENLASVAQGFAFFEFWLVSGTRAKN